MYVYMCEARMDACTRTGHGVPVGRIPKAVGAEGSGEEARNGRDSWLVDTLHCSLLQLNGGHSLSFEGSNSAPMLIPRLTPQ